MSEESFVYTACPGWGDHEYCAIKTIVKDGRIVRTEKADYTGPEAEEGYICQKGIMSCRQPYNKDRLLYPLKRAGERGEGKWERISWDQALDEIAAKMLEIRDKYGPAAISFWSLAASVPPTYGLGGLLQARFAGLWGASDPMIAYGLDNGPLFASYFNFSNPGMYMLTDPANFDDAKYLIVWGANPIENQQRIANHLIEAQSRGAKLVDIGLVFDGTAAKADWFIPVKPGSDPYLALAMANIIVEKGQYQPDFLINHTVAPFLVGDDDQYVMDGENYLVWDTVEDKAVPVAPAGGSIPTNNPALTGRYSVNGVVCKPVFQGLVEHLSQYSVESASKLTGVPVADIYKLTDEYVNTKPAYILGALGLRYQNTGESYRAFYLLGMLTGDLGKPGGGVTSALMPTSYPAAFNDMPITRPHGVEGDKTTYIREAEWHKQVISENPFPIKSLFVWSGNPVHNCPNRGRWIKETFPHMDLIVDFDIWLTDTGEYADYILPDCMPFERLELIASACYNHIVLQEPAIEPQGEARNANYVISELAKRVGLGEYFDKTDEEWLALRLETDYPLIANVDPPITMERLRKEKMVRMLAPDTPKFDPLGGLQFATKSGRMEFYAPQLADLGHGYPTYFPPLEAPVIKENKKYPYQFFTGRQRFFMQSMFTDDEVMVDLSGGYPTARINPLDAEKEGITDGTKVECYNDRGRVKAIMRLDQAIPPGTVQVWFGWRSRHFEEGTYSELLVPLGGPETLNDLSDRWWNLYSTEAGVGSPYTGNLAVATGAWDTIWDCACAIRKIEEGKGA